MIVVHVVDPFAGGLATFLKLLSEQMNHRKSRSDLIRILRDQTPSPSIISKVKRESHLHSDMQRRSR